MKYKFIVGADGKIRSTFYDNNGYLQLNCYAKDLQDNHEVFVVGKQNVEPTAEELLEEIENEIWSNI